MPTHVAHAWSSPRTPFQLHSLKFAVHQAAQEAQSPPDDGNLEALQAELAERAQQLRQASSQVEAAHGRVAESEAAAKAAEARAQHAQQENQRLVQSLRMATSQVCLSHAVSVSCSTG